MQVSDGKSEKSLGFSRIALVRGEIPLLYSESRSSRREGCKVVMAMNFPKCQKCDVGDLVPLSDFGSQGASIYFKAWACTNPNCGFNLKIRNGDLYIDEPITDGAMHTPRIRA